MANMRSVVRLSRCLPLRYIGYHHILMMLVIIATTVTAVLVAGAGSSSIGQRVYLVQFSYLNSEQSPIFPGAWGNITGLAFEAVKDTNLRVRVGYFGLCAAQENDHWTCRSSASTLMSSRYFMDPLGMTEMAGKIKDDVVFPGLFIGSAGLGLICVVLFSLFPGWHEERDMLTGSDVDVKPFPSRLLMRVCVGCSFMASVFTLTGAMWQHTASATAATILETSAFSVIKANVGSVAAALAWFTFSIWIIVFLGTMVMILSIIVLDRLTDED